MMRAPAPSPSRLACATLLVSLLLPAAAQAGQSDPVTVSGGSVRLLVGVVQGGKASAGIAIDLMPHWKTYWRYPGDAGVPPQITFSGSTNVKAVKMEWPAPRRFTEADATSIGYKGQTIFPLEITLEDPAKPAQLDIALDFAVCEALCLPARAELSAALTPGSDPAVAARLAAARAHLPVPEALAADGPLSVLKATLEPPLQPRTLVVEARVASAAADLFVEGPTAEWALPLPQKTPLAGGLARFTLALDGMPRSADITRTPLTLTLVDGPRAIVTETVPTLAPTPAAAGLK